MHAERSAKMIEGKKKTKTVRDDEWKTHCKYMAKQPKLNTKEQNSNEHVFQLEHLPVTGYQYL
jgi:hypothetical protein